MKFPIRILISLRKKEYVFILTYENDSQNSVGWSLSSVGISFRDSNNTNDNINYAQTYNSLNLEAYLGVTAREPRPISPRAAQLHPQIHLRHL